MKQELYQKCVDALQALETCTEREVEKYGEEGYQEVKEMESEAPAPSPCVDNYNAVISALLEYGKTGETGEIDLDTFKLGRFDKRIRASLAANHE